MNFTITIIQDDGTEYVAKPTLRDMVSAETHTEAQTHPVTYTARIAYSWARRHGKTDDPFDQWCDHVNITSANMPDSLGKSPAADGSQAD